MYRVIDNKIMQAILTLITSKVFVDFPVHFLAWLVWLLFLALLIVGLWQWWDTQFIHRQKSWILLAVLLFSAPLAALFFGVRLPDSFSFGAPGLPVEIKSPAIMLFTALPWVIGGGMAGPLAAVILGGLSGFFLGLFETHHIFSPLEVAGLALVFSYLVRQRYRSPFFRLMRNPLGAAVLLAVISTPVYFLVAFFALQGDWAIRLDFALNQTLPIALARGCELVIAAAFAQVLYSSKSSWWGGKGALVPSPAETSIQVRILSGAIPLMIFLVFLMLGGIWVMAGNSARRMMEKRLETISVASAESLPYFLETGQSLIQKLADENLLVEDAEQLPAILASDLRSVPFFRQLMLFDASGQPLAGYPEDQFEAILPSKDEQTGIALATRGVLIQVYTLPPWEGQTTAQVSFIAAIQGGTGEVIGVLLGRTDLESNPFTQPILKAMQTIKDLGGESMILDENGNILYDSLGSAALIMTAYPGEVPKEQAFFMDASPIGTRRLVYYQPVEGRPWGILLFVPVEQTQSLALDIAIPLLVGVLFLLVLALIFLFFALGRISIQLKRLSGEAALIAQGQLGHELQFGSEDEVGRLGRAFDQMRISLKARLEELNRLLVVTQGVAASLSAETAMQPVLEAAIGDGASMARVLLVQQDGYFNLDGGQFIAFNLGPAGEVYSYLDAQLLELMRQQDVITVSNTARIRRINLPANAPKPSSMAAFALRREHTFFGVLWIAYDQPHNFTEEQVRFLTTLAGEAALAAANARLYASAEIGRQRLQAILDSAAEPILVFDQALNLLVINPAAMHVQGLVLSSTPGRPLQEVISHVELVKFLRQPIQDRLSSMEINLPGGRIFYVSASPVDAGASHVGKVVILRDITHYKQLDSLKTDFVATVSHDLRSPLTLMRGYATMLQMVGELNEQQKKYAQKIVAGVETMSRLVNNLLDLGRIDAGVGLQVEPVNLDAVIEQVIASLNPNAAQKSIRLEQSVSPGLQVVVEADRALIQQAIYNMVENAVKYTPPNGKVSVSLGRREDSLLIEVADTGIGIAPLDLPHMFERFYRSGRREAYQQRGTGLGLALVKSIVERHHGRVWVDSQLGKGSKFYISIPYRQPVKPNGGSKLENS